MNWEFVDMDGHVGITLPWWPDNYKPIETRTVWYNPQVKWDEEYFKRFTRIDLMSNDNFQCWDSQTYTWKPQNITGWPHVDQERPVPMPRGRSKNWHWEWSYGRWVKR